MKVVAFRSRKAGGNAVLLSPKLRRGTLIFVIAAVAAAVVVAPSSAIMGAKEGVDLCARVIIPSLLPFMILIRALIDLGVIQAFSRRLPPYVFAFVAGLLSGYPMGAKIAADLLKSKLITRDEAEKMAIFCNNSGPLFIMGAVGAGLFRSFMAGVILYAAHILSAVTLGLFLVMSSKKRRIPPAAPNAEAPSGDESAVRESVVSLATVCAYIVLFSAIIRLVQTALVSLNIPPAAASVLAGLLEMTRGTAMLASAPTAMSWHIIIAIAAFLVTFGGLCVSMQTFEFLPSGGRFKCRYVALKAVQGVFAAVYAFFGAKFLMANVSTTITTAFSNFRPLVSEVPPLNAMVYALILALITTAMTLLTAILPDLSGILHRRERRRQARRGRGIDAEF
ncbi:MAG: hypothetical protein LBL34_00720 [Clostridiales bacterium]|jgi:sporulation integral membrane protein YlbJ|nr:hypothetical protein [Clostridiales bacterium]